MEEVVVVLVEVAQKVLLAELHESLVLVGNMLLEKDNGFSFPTFTDMMLHVNFKFILITNLNDV